jgi:hypothetical protein
LQQSKRTVAELPCSLSTWDLEDPVLRTLCSALGLIAIAMWQPILVQRSRETWVLPHTPSCFSALLKYTLQKINYAIVALHNLEFVLLFATQGPKARVGAPGLQQCIIFNFYKIPWLGAWLFHLNLISFIQYKYIFYNRWIDETY